ncbi:uncharacterized protein LOC62_07G008967 [Vanrija pseudolonga]|uniref:F-box domain-containing protein n=1 Tax=Vanrija pseudolonga TaxID=143232 RepID=A0AAF1BU13_9TREE|nr:hypothetical protein LOC62_07G008967 [Vanrija pseudolonga]
MPPWLSACLRRSKGGPASPPSDEGVDAADRSVTRVVERHVHNNELHASALNTQLANLPPSYHLPSGPSSINAGQPKPPDRSPPRHRLHLGAGANGSVSSLRRAVLSVHRDDEPSVLDMEMLDASLTADDPLLSTSVDALLARAKNPPTPPQRTVTIDHLAYPHIFEDILSYLSLEEYARLRGLNKAIKSDVDSKIYTHIWIRPVSGNAALEFLYPDSNPPRRLPGLRFNAGASRADRHLTLAGLHEHTRVVDMDLGETSMTPLYWKRSWDNSALAAAMSQVKVLRRLDERQGIARDHLEAITVGGGVTHMIKTLTADMHFETEVSFLHLNLDIARSTLISRLPVQISRPGRKNTVIAINLGGGCPDICNLPMPITVTADVSNLVILLLPAPNKHNHEPNSTAQRHTGRSLGILCGILKGLLYGHAWGEYTERRKITIGPMELINNDDLHLDLDEGVTLEERNEIILTKITTMYNPPHVANMFSKTISLLSLEEMQAKIGADVWDWVTVSPAALCPGMSG